MISIECNYSKKLGLPGYSSHQFSITLRAEIQDVAQIQTESARLYKLLQTGVDSSIREVGYLPNGTTATSVPNGNGSGGSHGGHNGHPNGNGAWECSEKQKSLILKIVDDNHLDKNEVENLAQERFSKAVKRLNKLEASGLIEELLERYSNGKGSGRGRFDSNQAQRKAGGR